MCVLFVPMDMLTLRPPGGKAIPLVASWLVLPTAKTRGFTEHLGKIFPSQFDAPSVLHIKSIIAARINRILLIMEYLRLAGYILYYSSPMPAHFRTFCPNRM